MSDSEFDPSLPWITCAQQWRSEHKEHVDCLIESSMVDHTFGLAFHPPLEEDKAHPELWKAASWLWLKRQELKHQTKTK